MEWYYANESDQQISFPEEDFERLVNEGAIKNSTLVWNETMTDWKPADQARADIFGAAAPAHGSPQGSFPPPVSDPSAPATPAGVPVQTVPGAPPVTGAYAPAPPADGLAIASLVCGILGFVCYPLGFFFGLAAVICGHTSRKKLVERSGSTVGGGLSLAGIILGYIGITFGIFFGIFMIIGILAEAGNI